MLTAKMNSKPGSKQWLDEQMKKHVPGDRHKKRMTALYVDPVSPAQWSRPLKEISPTDATNFLRDANSDYWMQYERYVKLENLDPELVTALTQWDDRPDLPEPVTRAF